MNIVHYFSCMFDLIWTKRISRNQLIYQINQSDQNDTVSNKENFSKYNRRWQHVAEFARKAWERWATGTFYCAGYFFYLNDCSANHDVNWFCFKCSWKSHWCVLFIDNDLGFYNDACKLLEFFNQSQSILFPFWWHGRYCIWKCVHCARP